MNLDDWITVPQAAALTGQSVIAIRKAIARGTLDAIRLKEHGPYVVPRAHALAWAKVPRPVGRPPGHAVVKSPPQERGR